MTSAASVAAGLRAVANFLDPAPAAPGVDLKSGVGVVMAVLREIGARKIDLSDTVAFANAAQQILVDLGIEPAPLLAASKLLEALAPAAANAYASGIVTGGQPDIAAQESATNFKDR